MDLPPMLMELRIFAPLRGMEHCMAPVSTSDGFAVVLDGDRRIGRVRPGPCNAAKFIERVAGPLNPAGTTVAKPLHLMDPSGQ